MTDLQIPGVDMEKFHEVMQKTSVEHVDIPLEKLLELKNKLVADDPKSKDVELRRLQGMLDIMNTVMTGMETYHKQYGFSDQPIIKEEIKPTISPHNKDRHRLNKLRPFATMDEKITRNLNHVANCKCGHIPKYVKDEIQKRLG